MKIIDQTRENGRHGVLLLAESDRDLQFCRRVMAAAEGWPVARVALIQEAGDARPSLLIEELEHEPLPKGHARVEITLPPAPTAPSSPKTQ